MLIVISSAGQLFNGGCARNDLLFEDESVIARALEELESEEYQEDEGAWRVAS